jgi:hypothetical protein
MQSVGVAIQKKTDAGGGRNNLEVAETRTVLEFAPSQESAHTS